MTAKWRILIAAAPYGQMIEVEGHLWIDHGVLCLEREVQGPWNEFVMALAPGTWYRVDRVDQ
jgi:hypothetical protein